MASTFGSVGSGSRGGSGGSGNGNGNGSGSGSMSGLGYNVVQPKNTNPFQIVTPTLYPSRINTQGQSQSNSNTTRSSTTNRKSNTQQIGRESTTIDRFDPKTRAQYSKLLEVLGAGGTDTMREGISSIQDLLDMAMGKAQEYSPDAARQQSQRAIPSYLRELREGIMPSIYGAQEGAGLSGDSMTALLAQDQATRVSEAAAANELEAIQSFGELGAQQQGLASNASEMLAADPLTQAMTNLMQIGKGAYEQSDTTSVVNTIVDEIIKKQEDESTSQTASQQLMENKDYISNLGGGGSGGGSGVRGSSGRNFKMGSSGKKQSEKLALLMASLGPFQNLQHIRENTTGAGGARGQSGRQIRELMDLLNIQL